MKRKRIELKVLKLIERMQIGEKKIETRRGKEKLRWKVVNFKTSE